MSLIFCSVFLKLPKISNKLVKASHGHAFQIEGQRLWDRLDYTFAKLNYFIVAASEKHNITRSIPEVRNQY